MSDEIETLAPNVEETPPVEDERVVVPMDCDPTGWKLSEQMAYRAAVGVNPQYAMLMLGKAFESEDPEQYVNIDPKWLLGIAWVTARRTDKFLTMDRLAEKLEYSTLLNSVLAWAEERAAQDPTPAPRKARRK